MRCNMLTILSVLLVMELYLRSVVGVIYGEILVYSIPEQLVGPRIISQNTHFWLPDKKVPGLDHFIDCI